MTAAALDPAVLYVDHYPYILRYLTSKTRDRVLAEDLAAETFTRAVRYAHHFHGGTPLAWLTTIARNVFLDHVKSGRWQREIPVDEFLPFNITDPDDPETVYLGTERAELMARDAAAIKQLITQLPGRQATCLQLRLVQNLPIADAARIMGVTTGAVKSAQHLAMANLERKLGDHLATYTPGCLPAPKPAPAQRLVSPPNTPLVVRFATGLPGTCSWPRCTNPAGGWGRGHCSRHYQVLYKTGRIQPGWVDPVPILDVLEVWRTRGRAVNVLAELSGVSRHTLADLADGTVRKARAGVAQAVLAVPLPPSDVGCARRVRALSAVGHGHAAVARQLGMAPNTLTHALWAARFGDTLAMRLAAAYPTLVATPGSPQVAARAAKRGDVPPEAWAAGIDIDDPDARPRLTPVAA